MTVSAAAARRRMTAEGYDARTINRVMSAFGGRNRTSVQNLTGGFGRGGTNLGRVLRGETPGRDK